MTDSKVFRIGDGSHTKIYALEAAILAKTKDEVLKKKDVDGPYVCSILPSTENNHTTC
jgi:hypothetical protein